MSFLKTGVLRLGARALTQRTPAAVRTRVVTPSATSVLQQWRYGSTKAVESDEAFDARWESYFNKEDIDIWDLKKGINEIYGHDLVPEPKIVAAMLKAARRLNDVAVAIRILEAVKAKAGGDPKMYNYVIDSVRPTLDELGLQTPEELGLA